MWQLTAVDIATRVAVVQLVVGDKSAAVAALLLEHPKKSLRKHGTALEEFYRPPFHRGRGQDVASLDRSLQAWVTDYNNEPEPW